MARIKDKSLFKGESDVLNALSNPAIFNEMISDIKDLKRAANDYPKHADALMAHVLSDPAAFKRICSDEDDLEKLFKIFPDSKENIIQYLLSHPDDFKRLFTYNVKHLNAMCEMFPNQAKEIVKLIMSDPDILNKLLKDVELKQLTKFAKQFSKEADTMVELILSHPDKFKFYNHRNLKQLAKFAEQFPERTEAMAKLVMSDPREVAQMLNYTDDLEHLIEFAKSYPKPADVLVNLLISNPVSFKRLIKNDDDLRDASKQFGKFKILRSESVEEAVEKIKNKIEFNKVRDASSALGQAKRDPHSAFFQLPPETLIKIAKDAADLEGVKKPTEKAADDVAHKAFKKPFIPKKPGQ